MFQISRAIMEGKVISEAKRRGIEITNTLRIIDPLLNDDIFVTVNPIVEETMAGDSRLVAILTVRGLVRIIAQSFIDLGAKPENYIFV